MTWTSIWLLAMTVLACLWTEGCITNVYPISQRIIVVPIKPLDQPSTTQPTTRPDLIPRTPPSKPA